MSTTLQRPGFAALLRSATRDEHERTERAPFVTHLMAGKVGRDTYALFLRQLVEVYRALEDDRIIATDPVAAAFADPLLARSDALHRDLTFLHGDLWELELPVLPATVRYAARIREVAASWPGGYVAHHYTRYLGDLSGGQALAASVRRHLDLGGSDGVAFFTFDGIESIKRYKDRYRQLLDDARWDPMEQDRIVDEACVAFRHNGELLHAVSDHR